MQQKPYSSPDLDKIRQRIDTLDHQIHDALMERAELVLKIGQEKRKNNIQIVQPAREARMIRRLLARHKGALPEMAVVRIWRELVGAVSLMQTGLRVAVPCDQGNHYLWDLAKDYFGSCLPFEKSGSILTAIAAIRKGEVNFAVLPWPEDVEDTPWWDQLDHEGDQPIQPIIRLPHGDDPDHAHPGQKALIVSQSGFQSSDDDCSFLLLDPEISISRSYVIETLEKHGVSILNIFSKQGQGSSPRHLVEVKGYMNADADIFKSLQEDFGEEVRLYALGGYPTPSQYSKTISVQTP